MLERLSINCHSSIRIEGSKTIYIDPFRLKESSKDADVIFITHPHYDHYSIDDINKILKEDTIIVLTQDIKQRAIDDGLSKERIVDVAPNKTYTVENIKFDTTFAYNLDKEFHPKQNNWVGYILNIDNTRIYIAGDTDALRENENIKVDIALVPIGGIYTMTYKESAEFVNVIKPKVVIPTHYGEIVGEKKYAKEFSKLILENIECKTLIKE